MGTNTIQNNNSELQKSWQSRKRSPFDIWIRNVSGEFAKSELRLERVCSFINANPAELEAVIQLSLLDEAKLKLLSESPPPSTTWFKLRDLDIDLIKKA